MSKITPLTSCREGSASWLRGEGRGEELSKV